MSKTVKFAAILWSVAVSASIPLLCNSAGYSADTLVKPGASSTSPLKVSPGAEFATDITAARCTELLAGSGVFIFFDPSCPVCAEYFPTIERLSTRFASRVGFNLVFRPEDAKAEQAFINEYHPHSKVWCDTHLRLQTALSARVSSEAFVLQAGKIVYSGRIDDRYESIGHRRNVIRSNDLEQILAAVSKGEDMSRTTTRAIGCYLESQNESTPEESLHARK